MLDPAHQILGPLPPRYKYQGVRRASRLTSPGGGDDPPPFVDTLLAYDRAAVCPSTRRLREEPDRTMP